MLACIQRNMQQVLNYVLQVLSLIQGRQEALRESSSNVKG